MIKSEWLRKVFPPFTGTFGNCVLHYVGGAAGRVLDLYSRGLIDLKGAVPDLARGLGYTAPTYVVGSRGRCPTATVAPHLAFSLAADRREAMSLPEPKAALRMLALERRRLLTKPEVDAFAKRLAEIGLGLAAEYHAQAVSGFWPIKNEPSTLLLLEALAKKGITTALPVMAGRDQPLIFRVWRTGDKLIEAGMKIMEPPPEAPEVLPDLLFVPLAAFDKKGGRIGYGAGFYDRTLAKLRALKAITTIGVAFEVQELPDLPQEPHDEPLDFVLTERRLVRCH